jgi:uncharacterized protein YbjT (DUF2867 family)
MSSFDVAVIGAAGEVGRRICAELVRAGHAIAIAGRRAGPLGALAEQLAVAAVHPVDARDRDAVTAAIAGARVVVNAAGPLADTAGAVLSAAMAAGAHYVDVGGEQAALHALYERHESEVRHAGLVALPGCGLDGALGDLAAAWAAAHLIGARDAGPAVRDAPGPRLAEDQPLDDVAIGLVLDHLTLSAGSQRALFGALGTRPLVWRRDRWEAGATGAHRRINAGAPFGERDAVGYAGGAALTIPRHLAAHDVATFVSTGKRAAALRLLARAAPLIPRAASALLAPYAEAGADYGRTAFAVVAQVRRGFAAAQVVVRGHDLYRTTARIAAYAADALAARGAGPIGMRAPGEILRAEPALRALATTGDLAIEPSFDNRGINDR